ncbi:SpoIIIAH-like family protein [Oscillibacter hominis]|uniref:SpoIIIAH-like family protein n=1 Tax=Oscillibacter hominis TaxID=2763056 RepID=A0A7G9B7K3_9FIRM|nr:SpoIIIAH-like family protein [Oscillibacter hominis]QNL45534.1 SpoIIIAH-like family protein [Oscillibacter hominis]
MNRNFKRNMVVATVLLFVCAAVYLNWKYAGNVADPGEAVETKTLGESTLVSKTETDGEPTDEAAVYGEGSDYFATARLTRQQARDNALNLLKEASEEENADQETLNAASEGIQALASYTLQEAQIENLVTAKGYTDCVAFMGADSLSVVVAPPDAGELTAQDVAKITDIAMTETGYKADQIKILPAN